MIKIDEPLSIAVNYAERGTTLIWKNWRVCTGDTKKERLKKHTTYKHTSQLSIGYTCEKERGRLQKKKDDREQEIHKNVVPIVNIVALCKTEELALRKVYPIAELLGETRCSYYSFLEVEALSFRFRPFRRDSTV